VRSVYWERGKSVTVLARWNGKGPRNVLIEREDGSRVVRPFRGLRVPYSAYEDALLVKSQLW
jgi:acetyl esterase